MTASDSRKAEFTAWLLSDVDEMKELGYTPTRFLQMVRAHGGLEACRMLLRPEIAVSHGFCTLHKLGRLDLSVEHIALDERWADLFNDQERETAQFRINSAAQLCSDPSLIGE